MKARLTAWIIALTVIAVLALPAATSHAAHPPASGLTSQLSAYLSGLAAQRRFSGVVLVAQHGKILLSKGYGMADLAHRVPNGPAVLYPVGGVGTTLPTWVAALQLEAQGKLHDAASVCAYLAPCPAAWRPITLGMLLAGTSGLNNYDWGNTAGQTIASRIRQCEALPLTGTPGGTVNYTGCAVIVVGTILERVTGRSWAALVGQRVLGPAGMHHSGRIVDGAAPMGLAHDYSFGAAHVSPEYYDDFYQLYATVGDVYALNAALFGGRLLSQATLQRIETPRDAVVPPDAGITGAHWGYRWKVGTAFGHALVYLTSGAHGFTIADLRFPKDDVTLVVISNDDQNDVEDVAVKLTSRIFGQTIAAPIMPVRVVSPASAVVASFNGTVGTFPFVFADEGLWFATQSDNGYVGTVTRIDTRRNRIVATINVSAPGVAQPEQTEGAVATGNGQIWAVDSGAQTAVRIDPATNKVVVTIHLGIPAAGVAMSGDTLWATADPALSDAIVRVDLRTQKVVAVIKKAKPDLESAASPQAFWYIATDTEKVMRVDAMTNKVVAAIDAGPRPVSLYVAAGSLWVWDHSGVQLTRVDLKTNKVTATITFPGYPGRPDCACQNVALGYGSIWTVGGSTTLLRIDPQTNRVTASLTFNRPIANVGVSDGSVWVASDGGSSFQIDRVDPKSMGAAPMATSVRTPIAALLGTYRRTFENTDRIAAHDPGLTDWVGQTMWIAIKARWIDFGPPGNVQVREYYTATHDGGLTMSGYLPDNQYSFCSSDPHLDPPHQSYRWARQGNSLIISRTGFDPCLDRGALLPGRWTKIG